MSWDAVECGVGAGIGVPRLGQSSVEVWIRVGVVGLPPFHPLSLSLSLSLIQSRFDNSMLCVLHVLCVCVLHVDGRRTDVYDMSETTREGTE